MLSRGEWRQRCGAMGFDVADIAPFKSAPFFQENLDKKGKIRKRKT
jgi:hypothetical protein